MMKSKRAKNQIQKPNLTNTLISLNLIPTPSIF